MSDNIIQLNEDLIKHDLKILSVSVWKKPSKRLFWQPFLCIHLFMPENGISPKRSFQQLEKQSCGKQAPHNESNWHTGL